jgi:hypothetical protein
MKLSTQSSVALAALGLVGTGGSAHAGLVTETYDLLPDVGVIAPVAVDSSSAQYYYKDSAALLQFGTNSGGLIASTGKDGTPTVDPSLTYASPASYIMAISGGTVFTNGYMNLSFTNGAGATEYGFATFDTTTGQLDTITYQAVPEPSTWALLITGAGALGTVARRRRRSRSALAAA